MKLFGLLKNNKNSKSVIDKKYDLKSILEGAEKEIESENNEKDNKDNNKKINDIETTDDAETKRGMENIILIEEPITKTIFIVDEGLKNREGELIKKIIRRQKGVAAYVPCDRNLFLTLTQLYKNKEEDIIIIKGNYENIASDKEISEFIEKLKNSNYNSRIIVSNLTFLDNSRKNMEYKERIRNYLHNFGIKTGLKIFINDEKGFEENKEEKSAGGALEQKIENFIELEPIESELIQKEVKKKEETNIENTEINFIDRILREQEKDFENLFQIHENESIVKRKISTLVPISEVCRNKISLNSEELKNLTLAIPYAWKQLFPWCEVEVNEKDFIRVGGHVGELVDAISFNLKEKETDKYTGDAIKINEELFVIWRNGKEYYAKPTEKMVSLLLDISKKNSLNKDNLTYFVDPIVKEVSEFFTKKKDTTLEQIIKEKGKDAKEFICNPGVAYLDSEGFIRDITAEIEKIAEEKGSLAGLSATNEYKAPDSTNAGEISLRFESEPFTNFYKAYPKIKERELTIINYTYGRQIIHALVEVYNNPEIRKDRLEGIKAMINTIPSVIDKKIVLSVVDDLKKNIQSNIQSNQTYQSKLNTKKLKGG